MKNISKPNAARGGKSCAHVMSSIAQNMLARDVGLCHISGMTLIFRLHALLKREYDALSALPEKRRHSVLGKRVKIANENVEPKGKIDARTLRRLACGPEGARLSHNNLIALHNYFATLGEPASSSSVA